MVGPGTITVGLHADADARTLTVRDDGAGLPRHLMLTATGSLGPNSSPTSSRSSVALSRSTAAMAQSSGFVFPVDSRRRCNHAERVHFDCGG